MSNIIQLLPDHVANQIAAGEVVQRPASVVKELMENSIDADANSIKLLIRDAGKTLIQVIDNGKGMSTSDTRLCFERHATSKIRKAEDLFNLNTKGFRGEALASIAAIAHVELKTKRKKDELGNQIKIEGSRVISQEFVAAANGSSLSVKNLFYNIPARRNFLKSDTIETRHIIDEFQRIALAHPAISFLLQHNNNEVYNLRSSNLRKRIVSIFGSKMNEKLVPIKEKTDLISIQGFITKPEFAKKKRGEQFFFVNDRFIKSSYLNHAVVNAFDGLLEFSSHPSYFLYLNVPPSSIDINIHPTKTEIKFDNEKALYAILRATIKHSLGQYNVAPILDFNRDANLDIPYDFKNKKSTSTPKIKVDPDFNPFKEADQKEIRFPYKRQVSSENWESLYVNIETDSKESKQASLFVEQTSKENGKTLQIQRKYLLSSIKSGVVLISQSLAHQRILYEDFLESITVKEANSQQLLFPINIQLISSEIEIIYSIKTELENAGFYFGEFTKTSITIKGIPISVTESQITVILEELIRDIDLEIPDASFSPFDLMAKSFSKTLAIKTGVILSQIEQENLVNDLFSCKEPSISPFGKSTFKTLTLKEVDLIFNN
ncbi:MAG: DNA mismatch repair protein MutL [Polaribacter sp. SA4-10]|nr:MAG: DNA mismatch repair protein MutL [Polaribacter sp. SA4-10]|tara:strand:- start:601 stop:2415 length:1815 start_codon:yes stop_codon:yes gene_type:complete